MRRGAASALAAPMLVVIACTSEDAPVTSVAAPDAAPVAIEEDAAAPDEPIDAGRRVGCPGDTPASYAWQPPAPKQANACTQADLDRLAAAIKGKALTTVDDIATNLGAGCAACAIGKVTDTTWKAVVAGHDGYIGNVGGCVVRLGGTEACGKTLDALSTCLIVGCDGCRTRTEQDTCADKLTTVDGACAGFLVDLRKSCTKAIIDASGFATGGVCESFVDTIRIFCGPTPQDAGGD